MGVISPALRLIEWPLLLTAGLFTAYLAALTLAALAWRRRPAAAGPPRHRFAVVVPAHNEAAVLHDLLRELDKLDYPRERYEVVVVADHCTDRTVALARAAGARVLERTDGERGGKGLALGWALECLLRDDRFDAFAILDADSRPAAGLLRSLDGALQEGHHAVQGFCKTGNPEESWRTALMAADLALVHHLRPLGRQTLGASAGLQGNGSCLTRTVLSRVPWRTRSVAEDQEYHLRLVLAGVRVRFVPEAVVETVMEPTLAAAEGQERRWEGGRLEIARAHLPELLRVAWARRSWPCFDAALDLATPPFALLGAGTALMTALNGGVWLAGGPAGAVGAWAALLFAQTGYVIAGCALARVPVKAYLALAVFAPLYALHKIRTCASVGRRGGAVWVPTARRI